MIEDIIAIIAKSPTVDVEDIDNTPTADVVEVKHTKWVDGKCTNCSWEMPDRVNFYGYEDEPWHKTAYCPSCGAKMKGDDDNGDL